jgi:hypothetical protein
MLQHCVFPTIGSGSWSLRPTTWPCQDRPVSNPAISAMTTGITRAIDASYSLNPHDLLDSVRIFLRFILARRNRIPETKDRQPMRATQTCNVPVVSYWAALVRIVLQVVPASAWHPKRPWICSCPGVASKYPTIYFSHSSSHSRVTETDYQLVSRRQTLQTIKPRTSVVCNYQRHGLRYSAN